jgi:hypothetical protein
VSKKSIAATVSSTGQINSGQVQNPYDIANGIAVITADYAAVVTDIAQLVTDGGSPTQAHVTTLAADWVTLKAVLDGLVASAAAAASAFNTGVVVQVDAVLVPTTTPVDAPRLLGYARG